ncbi:hypothetical protein [Paenibacillus sp. BIHB 4019]|nr:hypothetical protein [Paenibacillus sp. BIHB 4019]
MKKLVIGFILGLSLSMVGTAWASGLVGKTVGSEVKITMDGKSVGSGVIIDGKSYAPVRDVTNAAGLSVTFKDGVVNMQSGTKTPNVLTTEQKIENVKKAIANTEKAIAAKKKLIAEQEQRIKYYQGIIDKGEGDAVTQKRIDDIMIGISQVEKDLAADETKLIELKEQLAELESTK